LNVECFLKKMFKKMLYKKIEKYFGLCVHACASSRQRK
jgi:hypothetical protein